MKIAIFGLGYVGCVSTGCLADSGHEIIGVDVNEEKVSLINSGRSTIVEKDIDEIILRNYTTGRIKATSNAEWAVTHTDLCFICVGTPSSEHGQLNLDFVFDTAKSIGVALSKRDQFYWVAIRSTVSPGTNERVCDIIESHSGKIRNIDFAVVSNPEFLREGSAVNDYYNPALTVVGSDNDKALDVMREVYHSVKAPMIKSTIKSAEMIKYVNNTFHALKITFANEIGNICHSIGVDAFEVMNLFKLDDRLNISAAYLNPGMAYGGSCLPKDQRGLSAIAHDNYVKSPIIDSIDVSNKSQRQRTIDLVLKSGLKKIGIYGLAFKKGTDDLRYSPSVDLVEYLLGKGLDLRIYDSCVHLANVTGTNKSYMDTHLPHLESLLCESLDELTNHCEIIVVAHQPNPTDKQILSEFKGAIIDLVHIENFAFSGDSIKGICW